MPLIPTKETARRLKETGLTNVQIAKRLGVSKEVVGRWVSDRVEAAYQESQKKWKTKDKGRSARELYATIEGSLTVRLAQMRLAAKARGYQPCVATRAELLASHTGYCHICGVDEQQLTKRLQIDHCHHTGKFRGWLCARCNVMLGMAKDDVEILAAAIEYLERCDDH